jgi:hypothetical protein
VTDPDHTAGSLHLGSWSAKVAFRIIRIVGRIDRDWLTAHPAAREQIAAAPLGRHPGTPARKPVAAPKPGKWQSLFDGKTLRGWRVVEEGWFAKRGKIRVAEGRIVLQAGKPATGIAWTRDFPTMDYELCVDAMRVAGGSCFCGITFPIGDSRCNFALGGWDGSTMGIEFVDGRNIYDSGTARRMDIAQGRWYRVRVRVTRGKLQVWVDHEKVVDLPLRGQRFAPHPEWARLEPFGLGAYKTTAALRNIRVRRLKSRR